MRHAESEPLTAWSVAWDAWRAKRGGPAAIAARQQARVQALVEYARRASRFYAEHYRAVPAGPIRVEELDRLPSVTKPELMARFDDWVTDPAVIRVAVEEFVANLDNLGRDFLDRYVVFTTSGSTGVPAPPSLLKAATPEYDHVRTAASDCTISPAHLTVLLCARSAAGAYRPTQCLPARDARHLRFLSVAASQRGSERLPPNPRRITLHLAAELPRKSPQREAPACTADVAARLDEHPGSARVTGCQLDPGNPVRRSLEHRFVRHF
jgi:hypothetical protein